VPTLESLAARLSLSGVAAGVVLIAVSATATTAATPLIRTAPFAPAPARPASTTAVAVPRATTAVVIAPVDTPAAATSVVATTSSSSLSSSSSLEPSGVERVVAFALAQQGRPYAHGGAGPKAYDCSGLTMMAYRAAGIDLPHYSVSQAQRGKAVDWRREPIRAGDLVFMRGDTPVIDLGHVGLAISATQWVVASRPGTPVRVAPIPGVAIQRVRRLLP
jgi:cell wall-associated NlpC family hydrolase